MTPDEDYKVPTKGLLSLFPSSWVPYAELIRLDRPAGILYFYFPFIFGLIHTACLIHPTPQPYDVFKIHISLFISVVAFRGAAVAWNDILDADLDRQVARCRLRPMARKAISSRKGLLFAGVHLVTWMKAISGFSKEAIYYSILYAIAHAAYPLMKRLTHYAPVFLGFTFAWGVFVSRAILDQDLAFLNVPSSFTLYIACALWTVIYETIYQFQDLKDDANAGIGSMAVRYRNSTKRMLIGVSVAQVSCLELTGFLMGAGPLFRIGACGAVAASLIVMISRVNLSVPTNDRGSKEDSPQHLPPDQSTQRPRLKSMTLCTVGIVGGGLGGVAAAIGIAKAGHQVTVFEQAKALAEIGAGVEVPCNSTRILERWGILEKLENRAIRASNVNFRSYRNGSVLYTQNLTPSLEATYHAPFLLVHRADFLVTLADEARRLGVSIRLGTTISRIDFDKIVIHTKNDTSFAVDAIICADGLRSTCRPLFVGHHDPAIPTGHLAYRVTVATSLMSHIPELQALAREPDLNSWLGPDAHAITYQLKGTRLFNLVLVTADDLPESVSVTNVLPSEVEARLEGWDPRLRCLFTLAPNAVLKWKICTTPAPPSWVHSTGHAALLGDAAHASLPCLGQGAASALEDAAVLGSLFSHLTYKQQIPCLLNLYEEIRKPRATRLVAGAAQMRDFNHVLDGPTQQARDAELRAGKPISGWQNVYCDPMFQAWMFGADVVEEVERLWSGGEGPFGR